MSTAHAQIPSVASSASTVETSPSAQLVPPAPVNVKASSTDAFLNNFTLVAEAARRAQLAVMMRDFASIELSQKD